MNASELSEQERDKMLPPRFRSSAFRRYEAVLKQAVDHFPCEIEVDHTKFGLSLCTVEQRLRDAKTSYLKHYWNSTIDRAKFEKHVNDIRVCCRDSKIFIGRPKNADEGKVILGTYRLDVPTSKKPLEVPVEFNIRELAFLAQERALARPLRLTLSDHQSDQLYASFDINLEKQPDGFYILT